MNEKGAHLSDPLVGDIYYQYASIREKRADEYDLWLSDENGMLSKEAIFKKHLFDEQFFPTDGNPDLFCCPVQIVHIEQQRIYFYFLDKSLRVKDRLGEKNLTKKQFHERFFMPQHKMYEQPKSPI